MAAFVNQGTSFQIYWTYKSADNKKKQHWESYVSEVEALKRKAYIDYLQKNKLHDELDKAMREYKQKRAAEKAARTPDIDEMAAGTPEADNLQKTYREFAEKWLPFHARKNRFSPTSYDSYNSNLKNHILPYFGERAMSAISSEDIDEFMDYLSRKPCQGPKRTKKPGEIATLSSGTVKKCYTVLMAGFPTAKKWRYVAEIPETTAPKEKNKKRRAWGAKQVWQVLEKIDDKLLHLVVHIAFVCSLRAGETAGIAIDTIDFQEKSLWITQEIQRVTDESLKQLPENEIIWVFPKQVASAKYSLILKLPKTEDSYRKNYLPSPLVQEVKERLEYIALCKSFYGEEYQDYGLLICHPDGRPCDPKSLNRAFRLCQESMQLGDERIEFQGLRKSGQMHKVRLSKNNYQLVANNSGQSPVVLMDHYNETLDEEKRDLAKLVESSFYPRNNEADNSKAISMHAIRSALSDDPELAKEILKVAHLAVSD